MNQDMVGVSTVPTAELSGVISVSTAGQRHSSILLVLPLSVQYDEEGRLMVESQAANGLERWAENFESVTAACILTPESAIRPRSSVVWRRVDELSCAHRTEVIALPWAYKFGAFVRHYRKTRRLLRELISRSKYLVFGIGYLWGDWAALACLEALRQKRPYAVWTDLVDYQVLRWEAEGKPWMRGLYRKYILSTSVKYYHHHLIRQCKLGLFHGMDCYRAYAPFCANPQVVHNIHLKPHDAISPERREAKVEELRSGCPIRIGYVGRAEASKGAMDWLEVVRFLVESGHDVHATWLGDGPILAEMRSRVEDFRLGDRVRLPGFVADRTEVLDFLKGSHLLVFCHKVPESPRVLIESLVCGTPIVGYESPYPRDLIEDHGWGKLTPPHDVHALARAIGGLDHDRGELAEMVSRTSFAAPVFNDEAVFRHRSDLIKTYL